MADIIGRVMFNEADADVVRPRLSRLLVFVGSLLAAVLLPAMVGGLLGGQLTLGGLRTGVISAVLGATAGGMLFSRIAHKFFVSVPQAQAFVTLNPLLATFGRPGNPNIVYGPGLSFAFPWERRSARSNLSLEVITLTFTEIVPGEPVELTVTGSYQFKVNLRLAERFVGVNESTVTGGIVDLIQSEVSQYLSSRNVEQAKGEIALLNQTLGGLFGVAGGAVTPAIDDFEGRYGISSVAVTISGIDLPPDVQRARDAEEEAAAALRAVAAMYGRTEAGLRAQLARGRITLAEFNQMLNRTLSSSGNATMNVNVNEYSGLEGLAAAIVQAVIAATSGGGTPHE